MIKPLLALVVILALVIAAVFVIAGRPETDAAPEPASVPSSASSPAREPAPTAEGVTPPPLVFGQMQPVPGGEVTVVPMAPPVAGSPATFTVTSTVADVEKVEVFVGTDWQQAEPAVVESAGDGAWNATITLPDDTSGHVVLVRLILADGSILETGGQSFRL